MSSFILMALGVNAVVILGLALVFVNVGRVLGPHSSREGDADMPYETGMPPLAPAYERMTASYWRFAVLFVVFDVDLAFLLPWALSRPTFGLHSLLAVTAFVGIVLFMLVYFWRKGVLECR